MDYTDNNRIAITTAQLDAYKALVEDFNGVADIELYPWSEIPEPWEPGQMRCPYVIVAESDKRAGGFGIWFGATKQDRPGYIFIGIEPDGYAHS